MKAIKLLHVLLEYDYPQVFVGVDAVGGKYVCMISGFEHDEPVFICTQISSQRCDELYNAKIDLRAVYEFPELAEFYSTAPNDMTDWFEISYVSDVVLGELLPDSGLVFNLNDEVLNKAQELHSTVAYASLSVPEAACEPRIRIGKLSGFLAIYQSVIKNLSKAVARESGKPIPKAEEPYESDVFGFCYGSFTVQIRSASPGDILGENKYLVSALARLNDFLSAAEDPDRAVELLLSLKGHAASSLINLLNFISENNCQLTNRWSTPSMHSSSAGRMRVASAQNIIQRCLLREDLSIEDLKLVGIVDSADATARTWKILVDGVAHSGRVEKESKLNFDGLVLGRQYSFQCEEKIEMVSATGKEFKTLNLVHFKPA